jgi:hypothetical protein
MRLRKPGSRPPEPAESGVREGRQSTLSGIILELVAIAREMLRIPAGLYMRIAEWAGAVTLAGWHFLRPLLQALWRLVVRLFRVAEREVTPLRAALAVAAAAAVALAAAQFADYRAIAIGTGDYVGVDTVAPPPEVTDARDAAGSAHAWLGIPLAVAALVVVFLCARGNRRAAWWLAPIGIATIAISLIVDAPKGLDEGSAAVAYQGAEASLLGGFWVQLACGVLLVALAPLISGLLAPGEAGRARAWRRRVPRVVGESS